MGCTQIWFGWWGAASASKPRFKGSFWLKKVWLPIFQIFLKIVVLSIFHICMNLVNLEVLAAFGPKVQHLLDLTIVIIGWSKHHFLLSHYVYFKKKKKKVAWSAKIFTIFYSSYFGIFWCQTCVELYIDASFLTFTIFLDVWDPETLSKVLKLWPC